jgi:TolA-binding protein
MRGTIDELQNEQRTETAALKKQIGDLGFQMQQSGAAGAGSAAAAAPPATGATLGTLPQSAAPAALPLLPPVAGAAPTPAAPRTPELAIRAGYAALARGDYPTAESDAREVLARGSGPRANDAQYLLARSLNAQRNWRAAAVAYDDAYNAARTGPHAQESLLGLANALVAMGDKSAACGAIARLRSQFPTPRADLRRAVSDASSRAGCR